MPDDERIRLLSEIEAKSSVSLAIDGDWALWLVALHDFPPFRLEAHDLRHGAAYVLPDRPWLPLGTPTLVGGVCYFWAMTGPDDFALAAWDWEAGTLSSVDVPVDPAKVRLINSGDSVLALLDPDRAAVWSMEASHHLWQRVPLRDIGGAELTGPARTFSPEATNEHLYWLAPPDSSGWSYTIFRAKLAGGPVEIAWHGETPIQDFDVLTFGFLLQGPEGLHVVHDGALVPLPRRGNLGLASIAGDWVTAWDKQGDWAGDPRHDGPDYAVAIRWRDGGTVHLASRDAVRIGHVHAWNEHAVLASATRVPEGAFAVWKLELIALA